MSRALALLITVLLAVTPVACGGASATSSPPSIAASNAAALDTRLQGAWRLVDYRPEVPPDPIFQALLASQVGVLIVRFERGTLHADSPTLHTTRAYRVVDATGPLFTVESPDVGGAVFTSSATLSEDGQGIVFRGNTEPWRGSGTLVRVP